MMIEINHLNHFFHKVSISLRDILIFMHKEFKFLLGLNHI